MLAMLIVFSAGACALFFLIGGVTWFFDRERAKRLFGLGVFMLLVFVLVITLHSLKPRLLHEGMALPAGEVSTDSAVRDFS